MEKRSSCTGISVVLAAAVLGSCIVAAAIILVLPRYFSPASSDPGAQLSSSTPVPFRSTLPPSITAPVPTRGSRSLTTIHETFVEDKFEGKSPDFRMLIVSYDDETVYVTLTFNSGINRIGAGDFVYLYGTHHDMIRLGQKSFGVERDGGGDGHFEERVYSGSVTKIASDTISMEIPLEHLPDICEKQVWGYSMQSKDRIPDDGALLMPDAAPTR
jgi:hypothetical protein